MTSSLLSVLQPFAVSLLIGLAVGIERERSASRTGTVMGVRTFSLLAILGTTVAEIGLTPLTIAVSLFVSAMIALGYWRSTVNHDDADKGLTTEFAACLVFVLGYLTRQEPLLAAVLGILLVSVLYYRRILHRFAKDVLKPNEITSALILAAFVFVVIPALPDERIDPWQLFNPRKLAQVIAMIAAVEFFGYVAQRLFGAKKGALVAGFLGGLASSTATFVTISRRQKSAGVFSRALAGAAMLATMSPLLLYLAILMSTSPQLLRMAGTPVAAAALLAGGLGVMIARRAKDGEALGDGSRSPLDVKGVVKFGTLIFTMLVATAVARRELGASGADVVAFVGGLFELHGITLANASMHAAGSVPDMEATQALLLAVIASLVSKVAIAWALAPGRFAVVITTLLTILAVCGAVVFRIMLV